MFSRRQFLAESAVVAVALASTRSDVQASEIGEAPRTTVETTSLCGQWKFQVDPTDIGTKESWSAPDYPAGLWYEVKVPHTWQIDPEHSDYRGIVWYRRAFDALPGWRDSLVRLEFEAVFHSATIWVNGQLVGAHSRKGYTSFTFDISPMIRWGEPNIIAVRVDNAFDEHMLPRGRSSDWANDGGIFRPVQLLVTPKIFVDRVSVEAVPNLSSGEAAITISTHCRNTTAKTWSGTASCRIFDDDGQSVEVNPVRHITIEAGKTEHLTLQERLPNAKLWHFDSPHLYRLDVTLSDGRTEHSYETTFGIREFKINNGKFQLNGEAVQLMGVERMAGSNPTFGMAEPSHWIQHDHRDLKNLNCIFTRVHWPQDRRVLDYCDQHGILMQTEIPTWGGATFKGMGAQPDADIMENGLEQLHEMIGRDRNHPSVVVWGLCNEIDGQNPAAYQFAKRMLEEAKKIDPSRLCSYASHSLRQTPERDVAGLMDFIEANEYFGSWQNGDGKDLNEHLDTLHATFPGKPIVISEYGYCACTPERPEGDDHRMGILRTHNEVIRSKDFVGGAIFFCYNDYRTHMGDRGTGPLQQRVHGVVDVYGTQKASYSVLRSESSPIESMTVENRENAFHVVLKNRRTIPCYTLRGYSLMGVFYGQGDIPIEAQEAKLPELLAGQIAKVDLSFAQREMPLHVRFEVLRPTGFSAHSVDWKP
jgi:beta-galactosidase